jgi:hypothetical protein
MIRGIGLLLMTAASCVLAQQPVENTGARELFYFAKSPKDKLAPIVKTASVKNQKGPAQPPPAGNGAGAVHLGLRYTLVLVNPDTRKSVPVDSDRNFRNGECVAIDIDSNRSGYLYVLAKQSSGDWKTMVPSLETPGESNVINPEGTTRVPKEYCFEIGSPAGAETLFVVLSRDPRDVYDLNEGIKGNSAQPPATAPIRNAPPLEVADARLVNSEVQRMTQQFGTRDIAFRKISQPKDAEEPAHAVYAVNASDKPSSSIAIQIVIGHN